jgi:low temperature requirement protein LtrA
MPRHENETYEVVPLELFFDLVYAFAFTQLSHHLAAGLSWRRGCETLVLLVTVVTAWSFTSWVATHVRVDRNPSAQWMMVVVAVLGLFMNAMISGAFEDMPWAFALPMLAIQLGRTIWCIASVEDRLYRAHYARMLVWLLASTPLWIAGASAPPGERLAWWAAATGIELIGTWLAHPLPGHWLRSERLAFDGEHMLERCRLFLMIALGEAVLSAGAAISEAHVSFTTVVDGTAALVGCIALFSLLFGAANRRVSAYVRATPDPVHATRHAMNVVMFVAAGLVAVAVADELIIHASGHERLPGVSLLLFGGPALIVAATGWYQAAILGLPPRFNVIAAAVLAAAGLLSSALAYGTQLILASLALVAIAWLDNHRRAAKA